MSVPHMEIINQEVYDKFCKIDDYICSSLLPQDNGLELALSANDSANLPPINVAPNQGKMLYLLAKMNNAKRILEIGTGGGYSTIWLAKAITPQSGGKVITLEISPECAKVARSNIRNAGFHAEDVIVREGPALKTLELMHEAEQVDNFDFVFIDADKQNNVEYFRWALRFSHVGTLIVVDSIGRRGRLAETESSDETVLATRKLFEEIKREKRVDATAVQTVGSKGWDGFALLLVVE